MYIYMYILYLILIICYIVCDDDINRNPAYEQGDIFTIANYNTLINYFH